MFVQTIGDCQLKIDYDVVTKNSNTKCKRKVSEAKNIKLMEFLSNSVLNIPSVYNYKSGQILNM